MNHKNRMVGFTLIEMLLALTLTAVLLTIVSVTIGSVLRDNQRLETMRAEPLWLEALVQVIRHDLRQSDSYLIVDGVLTLNSHAGVAGDDNQLGHDRVTIEYTLVKHDDARWLVRRSTPKEAALINQTSPAELLCGGIQAFHLAEWSDEAGPAPEIGRRSPEAVQAEPQMLPIPAQLMLSVTLAPPATQEQVGPIPTTQSRTHAGTQPRLLDRLIVIR